MNTNTEIMTDVEVTVDEQPLAHHDFLAGSYDSPLTTKTLRLNTPFKIFESSFSKAWLDFEGFHEGELRHLEPEKPNDNVGANIYFGMYADGQTFIIAAVMMKYPYVSNRHVKLIEMLECAKKTWTVCTDYSEDETSDKASYFVPNWSSLVEPDWALIDPIKTFVKIFKQQP